MKFAEFYAGEVIEAGPYKVDEEEMLRFAKAYDPQWFHVDTKTAAEGRYGGLFASGWQTCAIGMRLAVDNVLMGSETVGSPGVAYIKWPNPVRPGDRLTLRAEVLETRRSKSQPDLGIMRWRWRVFNQAWPGGAGVRGDEPVRLEPEARRPMESGGNTSSVDTVRLRVGVKGQPGDFEDAKI